MNVLGYEFSSRVSIELKIGGTTVDVEQACGEFVITALPFDLPPGEATLIVSIDGRPFPQRVYLSEGVRANRTQQPIVLLDRPSA